MLASRLSLQTTDSFVSVYNRTGRDKLFISEIVVQESSGGDPEAAKRRVTAIEGLPELAVSEEAELLATRLLADAAVPEQAKTDALHIAVATVHGIDYLLTWNCKHIANATMRPRIEAICRASGYEPPVICTPLELIKGVRVELIS